MSETSSFIEALTNKAWTFNYPECDNLASGSSEIVRNEENVFLRLGWRVSYWLLISRKKAFLVFITQWSTMEFQKSTNFGNIKIPMLRKREPINAICYSSIDEWSMNL